MLLRLNCIYGAHEGGEWARPHAVRRLLFISLTTPRGDMAVAPKH
jgi:hypothetical protein